jgi:hypothetical protein
MLMQTDNRSVDHLHGGVMSASESVHDLDPDARSSAPSDPSIPLLFI